MKPVSAQEKWNGFAMRMNAASSMSERIEINREFSLEMKNDSELLKLFCRKSAEICEQLAVMCEQSENKKNGEK